MKNDLVHALAFMAILMLTFSLTGCSDQTREVDNAIVIDKTANGVGNYSITVKKDGQNMSFFTPNEGYYDGVRVGLQVDVVFYDGYGIESTVLSGLRRFQIKEVLKEIDEKV